MPRRPHGFVEICEMYGDPRPYLADGDDGDWQRKILVPITLPFGLRLAWDPAIEVRKLRVHRLAAPQFAEAFRLVHDRGLESEVTELGGVYAWRGQRGKDTKPSTHLWGIAIDLNPRSNRLGTHGDMHPGVVRALESVGFYWGGNFHRPDPMHFQLATGY